MDIRAATQNDWPDIWSMLEPVFRAGKTYAVPRDISEEDAKGIWLDAPAATFIATDGGPVGTYYIKTNFQGAASHVCNCGYVTSDAAQGRGIARAMCEHSQSEARAMGYRAMNFNLVLASNANALALWHKLGFETRGTLPSAFDHPELGMVDAHVMWKPL